MLDIKMYRDSKIQDFLIFCLEEYRAENALPGDRAFNTFYQFGVFDYLAEFYDVLHSFGVEYLLDDIDNFIASKSPDNALVIKEE